MPSRAKKTGFTADRISNLPITLIHHILSFLPAKEMVKTCIFSKNWRNVWFSAPSLRIDNIKFKYHPTASSVSFEQFVDFLLLTRSGSSIHKFSFHTEPEYDNSESETEVEAQVVAKVDLSPSKVNVWILYALRHNVEVIELKSYMSITHLLFSCESLRELRLTLNRFDQDFQSSLNLPSSVNLPSLRVLHLNGVFIQAGQLDDAFFSAMPCLETLNLVHCNFSQKKLSIVSTFMLTTLMMTGSFLVHFELSISAPNLKCLKPSRDVYSGSMKTIRFKNNSIQLTNANMELGVSCSESMIELFAVLRNTSSLKLSSWFLKSFTSELQNGPCIEDCIKTPFHNLTHMELGTVFSDDEALVINNILYHSPCIEVLRIVMVRNSPAVTVGESSEAEDVWSKFKLSRLKLVEIDDFQGVVNQIRFVKFLLENELVLEDMIVATPRYGYVNKQQLKIVGKELLQYPRASPNVVMQFG
ncbi:hypothetical protein ACHQM5_025036 [Ranunculus cassubicifolius]